MDYQDRRMQVQQIRPIARNLKAPLPPKFIDSDFIEPKASTFKSNMFVLHTTQKVRISHYDKGVHLFYVQMESLDSQLQTLMEKLQRIQLRNLRTKPSLLGMACLARHHKKIHRVAIAKINNDQSQDNILCNFVDYGYTATIKFENLFYIPDDFLNQPTFAMPFSFARLKYITFKSSIQEINYYFKEITEERLLSLKCVNFDGPPLCQYCELFDNDKNILEILTSFNTANLQIPLPKKLEFKKEYPIKVVYVESAQEFYVQLQDAETIMYYDMLYLDMQRNLPQAPVAQKLKPNTYVGVFIDQEWYRGKILEMCDNNSARVQVVDFGIIEEIPAKSIKLLLNKFINTPSYSYRCCLNGFQSMEVSENITTQFEIFCGDGFGERKIFKMRLEEIDDKFHHLVELVDSNSPPTNVNQMLLKNSRPLAETITIENTRKRQRENQRKDKDKENSKRDVQDQETVRDVKSPEKNRSSSQRGRGNYVGKGGVSRISPSNNNNVINKRQRTHFDKSNSSEGNNANSIGGTYFKTPKEANVWRNEDSKSQQKPADWNQQAKNIAREQNSDSDWNETENSIKKNGTQKSKSTKGSSKKQSDNDSSTKQKTPPKQEKPSNNKQKSPSIPDDRAQKSPEKTSNANLKCGWVSTLVAIDEAYVHFEEHIDGLEKILDELFRFYETQKSINLKNPKVGLKVAFKSQDSNWYRCEILSIDGDYCKVRNQEYGNVESVLKSNMRVLDERFKKYGKLVEKAYFNIKPIECDDDNQLIKEMLALFNEGTKELQFEIIKSFKDGYILDPLDPENKQNLLDVLVKKKKMALRISDEELSKILDNKIEIEKENLKKIENAIKKVEEKKAKSVEKEIEVEVKNVKEEDKPQIKSCDDDEKIITPKHSNGTIAKLTALTSPNEFYLTRLDMLHLFNQLHTDIQILAPAMQPLIDFECGTFCLAQEPFDSLWYRAKIIDSDESDQSIIITVLCIDNGKTFSIDNKICLKTMPEQLQQKTFFGIPCSLTVKIERKFEDDANEMMLKMVESEMEYMCSLKTPQMSYIELFYNNENVADLLVEKKFAKRFEIFPSGNGYTSHINAISDFYMQLEVDQLKLDLISSIIDRANGKFDQVADPKVGQIVAAKFPDDDNFYRSRIESIESDGYIVTFIDYGNSCLVKEIGIIDESITELPAMSKRCSLVKPKNISNFSQAAEEKFLEITANGATVLNIKIVKPGVDVAEVELFCNGQNIIDSLAPLCKLESDLNEL